MKKKKILNKLTMILFVRKIKVNNLQQFKKENI